MTTPTLPATAARTVTAPRTAASPGARTRSTRALLTAGAAAAPLWTVAALSQVVLRDGFDITRHPLSALSNGELGWIQIATFLLTGALLAAGGLGLRRDAGTGRWAPRLLLLAGVGMIAAGVLVMDPADGFPVGTPDGPPATLSAAGIGHMAAGTLTFTSLIAAHWVLARRAARAGLRGRAVLSGVAGAALFVGNGWAMSGAPAGTLVLAVGAITALLGVTAVLLPLRSAARTAR
ncbi:DUF998 domain-containing protein [Streptomyces sp. NPDC000594]|uniref:DUF998 domain-containing protein n=1 Tax=Streptomyces sp. NPDC000594 TaxID=3154261 RepID=UPI00332F6C11